MPRPAIGGADLEPKVSWCRAVVRGASFAGWIQRQGYGHSIWDETHGKSANHRFLKTRRLANTEVPAFQFCVHVEPTSMIRAREKKGV